MNSREDPSKCHSLMSWSSERNKIVKNHLLAFGIADCSEKMWKICFEQIRLMFGRLECAHTEYATHLSRCMRVCDDTCLPKWKENILSLSSRWWTLIESPPTDTFDYKKASALNNCLIVWCFVVVFTSMLGRPNWLAFWRKISKVRQFSLFKPNPIRSGISSGICVFVLVQWIS